jgi:hypothetical protein
MLGHRTFGLLAVLGLLLAIAPGMAVSASAEQESGNVNITANYPAALEVQISPSTVQFGDIPFDWTYYEGYGWYYAYAKSSDPLQFVVISNLPFGTTVAVTADASSPSLTISHRYLAFGATSADGTSGIFAWLINTTPITTPMSGPGGPPLTFGPSFELYIEGAPPSAPGTMNVTVTFTVTQTL